MVHSGYCTAGGTPDSALWVVGSLGLLALVTLLLFAPQPHWRFRRKRLVAVEALPPTDSAAPREELRYLVRIAGLADRAPRFLIDPANPRPAGRPRPPLTLGTQSRRRSAATRPGPLGARAGPEGVSAGAEIHRGIQEGSLDLGLVNYLQGDDLPPDFHTTQLLSGRPVVCLRPDSPLARLSAVGVADLLTNAAARDRSRPRPTSSTASSSDRPSPGAGTARDHALVEPRSTPPTSPVSR
ncbi:LysR substrate-binding domain-containing protein [Streptacidiphilus sp. P02-A3a]|uniref:LysR substrate-binding domain-containing protein n=1 Tax=Streptacidiphilus sp. P02-A3a TaxID=2704468 RepID=UPI001CDBA29D|nr:LysR substrate-binding domain-containing protein [Streptacidiphilus sp. P02-A3a]